MDSCMHTSAGSVGPSNAIVDALERILTVRVRLPADIVSGVNAGHCIRLPADDQQQDGATLLM